MVIKKIPETLVFAPFSVRLKRVECKDGPEDNPFDTLAEGLGAVDHPLMLIR